MSILYSIVKGKIASSQDYSIDLTGKTVIITGANAGIGFEAALKLVTNKAKRVILGVRSTTKGTKAKETIEARTGLRGVIEVWHLDMLDYASIEAFATRAQTEIKRLDYAILNAGIAPLNFSRSAYGWETTLQVNLISTTLLALHLLPQLKANTRSDFTPVLEIIGSGMHLFPTKLSAPGADDPAQNPLEVYSSSKNFGPTASQYTASKLFLMYIYAHLVRLADTGAGESRPFVQVVCPGFTQSNLSKDGLSAPLRLISDGFKVVMARTTEKGARTYVAGLTLGGKGHGKFWQYDRIQPAAPLLVDAKAGERQERVWAAVLEALRKDVLDVDRLVAEAGQ